MSGIPRIPRDIDPRRPKTERDSTPSSGKPARSYGQSAELPERDPEDIGDWEDLTEEPAREGEGKPGDRPRPAGSKKTRELREFEDLAGEPVLDDQDDAE